MSSASCPHCGTPRHGVTRRCHACGYDFWGAAAGSPQAQPQVTFLPDQTDAPAPPAGWWQRRSRRQKGATLGGAAFAALLAIGYVNGGDTGGSPTGAGAPASPTATSTATATKRPTPEVTPALGREPIGQLEVGRVVDVVDGDTIKVDIAGQVYTVRYIGIDTPETVHPSEPVGWMGPEASAANADLVAGQEVTLERDVSETDSFGRLLRYVWLREGAGWLLVNQELVRLGFASSSSYPPDVLYQDLFVAAEREARNAGAGLWGATPTPVPSVAPPPARGNCDPSYPGVCIPPYPPDLDCGEIAFKRFTVLPPDPHGFDGDHDGIGCES